MDKAISVNDSPGNSKKALSTWIDLYKKLISNKLLDVKYNELYKWETIQHFQDNWKDNHKASTILSVLKNSFNKENNNLWSGQNFFPFRMLTQFAEIDGETVSGMFHHLYDEGIPLADRFKVFYAKSEELLLKVFPKGDKVHYQSDRVLILYLTLRYPDKYYLYKAKMFKTFCELTGFWDFPKTKKGETFKKVTAFNEMCEALNAQLVTDPELIELHKNQLPSSVTFDDKYHLLTQDFIYAVATYLNTKLPGDEEDLSERDFLKVLQRYSKEEATIYFNTLDGILAHLKITKPDERIVFSCKLNQLSFIIGHRYGFVLFKEKRNVLYGVMTSTPFGNSHVPFGKGSNLFYSKLTMEELGEAAQNNTNACLSELANVDSSRDAENLNPYFEKAVFDKDYRNKILNPAEIMQQSSPSLNQIFFGPPGTGKTYHTVNEAIRIVDPEFYKLHAANRDELKARFQELLIKDWESSNGQIAFCTFHQSFSYEDFVEGIKPMKPIEGDTHLKYVVEDGIFKRICTRSISSIISRGDTFSNSKGGNLVVTAANSYIIEIKREDGQYITLPTDLIIGLTKLLHDKVIELEDIQNREKNGEHLQQFLEKKYDKYIFGYDSILKPLLQMVLDKPRKESEKKFVLIIDEINRGNVSSIFGELITLIEKDKRAGGTEQLEVTLPYSKDPFMVPDNVHIIGTMNTADRSIEALDTALRRRFSFREMPSKSQLIKTEGKLKPSGKIGSLDVAAMLDKINDRIGKLIDKDHKIGHSYFMDIETIEDLKTAFHNKVIPLLEEYFFGDFGKIGLVLGNSFVDKDSVEDFDFADFKGYDEDGGIVDDLKNKPVYRITDKNNWDFSSI